MKKLIVFVLLVFTFASPNFTEAKSFSGHRSYSHSTSIGSSSSVRSGGTYHSGYKSPSNSVKRTPNHSQSNLNNNQSRGSWGKSLATHAAAFGAGAILGHMLHPFGGGYYGPNGGYNGSFGFSLVGLLVDILLIAIIIWVIKSIFTRKRRF